MPLEEVTEMMAVQWLAADNEMEALESGHTHIPREVFVWHNQGRREFLCLQEEGTILFYRRAEAAKPHGSPRWLHLSRRFDLPVPDAGRSPEPLAQHGQLLSCTLHAWRECESCEAAMGQTAGR